MSLYGNVTRSARPDPDEMRDERDGIFCEACGEPCYEVEQDWSYDDGRGTVTEWVKVSHCCEAGISETTKWSAS